MKDRLIRFAKKQAYWIASIVMLLIMVILAFAQNEYSESQSQKANAQKDASRIQTLESFVYADPYASRNSRGHILLDTNTNSCYLYMWSGMNNVAPLSLLLLVRTVRTDMTIAVNKDDYVIVRYRNKPVLCFVLNAKSCRAVVEKTLHTDEPENITYEDEHILCNLGPTPQNGKIYGIDITPYRSTIETKTFGPIHLFRDVPKKEMKALRSAMKKIHSLFAEKASVAFLPLYQIHILPKKGKYAGCYIAKSKGSEVWDQIKLHPETFADPLYNEYLVAHEFAHGLWYRCVPLDLRAKWIKLYQKRRKLNSIDHKHLDELYSEFARYEGGIRDYMKEVAEDEEKLVIKEILTYFKRYQSMSVEDVELLLRHDSGKLAEMWPTRALLTETRPDISTYSLKNVEEFFAEAVAYKFTGRQLPADVQKGLDATFKKCRQIV